jgi:hypothetical protein
MQLLSENKNKLTTKLIDGATIANILNFMNYTESTRHFLLSYKLKFRVNIIILLIWLVIINKSTEKRKNYAQLVELLRYACSEI